MLQHKPDNPHKMQNIVDNLENKVIELFKTDYDSAFSNLFKMYYAPLCGVAARYVDSDVAKDIVHSLFLALWEKRYTPTNPHSMRSYLYTSIHNRCLNELRNSKGVDSLEESAQISADELDTNIIDDELFRSLVQSISELPENYKQVINMSLKGSTIQEIATEMDKTTDSVKANKRRAHLKLKDILDRKLHFLLMLLD